MMRNKLFAALALVLALSLSACQSSTDKSVKTNYREQWTTVNADVKTTTAAAEAVLNDLSLLEVKSSATNVDGSATAKKAGGAKIDISIGYVGEEKSKVTVQIGTTGDPTLGTDLARKIKRKAEGGGAATRMDGPVSVDVSTTQP